MQNASRMAISNESYDAHEAAGRATSIMSLLVPDLRLFIKRCMAKHCEDEAVATTPKKKKKKAVTTPTKQQLSTEAGALMNTIVSGTVSELDFVGGLKFIDKHWKLVFEPHVGVYATELRCAISTAISCRNKVAHQALLSPAMSFDCFDALNGLAVLVCAEKATKRKIRALLSQKSAVDHASTLQGVEVLQKSLDAFTATQLKQGEEYLARLIGLEYLSDNTNYYAKSWLVRSIEEQLEDNGTKLEELTQTLAKQTQLVHSLCDQVKLLQNSISTGARDRWNTPRTILDDLVLFAKRQEDNAKLQERLSGHQGMRLEALALQTQEDTRALKNQVWWSKLQLFFCVFVVFSMVQATTRPPLVETVVSSIPPASLAPLAPVSQRRRRYWSSLAYP